MTFKNSWLWFGVIFGFSLKVALVRILLRWWKWRSIRAKIVVITGASSGLGECMLIISWILDWSIYGYFDPLFLLAATGAFIPAFFSNGW
jgi:hypothetical protein